MTHYILFGGKGGVGKTSCAAATALHYSKKGKKTLVVSTDPAHSLSDSFETKIGSKEKQISENLFAVEIDPKEAMEKVKEKIGEQPEMPAGLGPIMPGMDMSGMMGGMGDMPGMDEMAAFDKFLQYIDSDEYDYVIFDTAPTGHTLKFLSLPELMDSFVGKMLKLKLQLSNAMSMFKQLIPFSGEREKDNSLGALEEMKARIEKGKLVLTNPNKTEFVLVMIPQEMSVFESERARKTLEDYGIKISKIVVNQIQPSHKGCDFCTSRRDLHQKQLGYIHKNFKKAPIVEVPLSKDEVKGRKLEEFSKQLFK